MHAVSQIAANRLAFHLILYFALSCKKVIAAALEKIVKLDIKTSSHEMRNSSHLECEW